MVRGRPDQGRGGPPQGGAMREAIQHIRKLDGLAEWKAEDLVERADGIGRELENKGVTTSQIRNFLDEVNRIDAEVKGREAAFDSSRVVLLKPLLAYAAGRESSKGKQAVLKDFTNLFSAAADRTANAADFKRFIDFTRAVVAYHRFHGGSNR